MATPRIHDGSYGTLLAQHLHGDETVDDLCLRAPALVIDAHRAYVEAGAQALQTNAFLAHLRSSERRRRELQRAALACAREAAATADATAPVAIYATIGPAGSEPRDFWHDIETVLDADARGVLCETVTTRAVADAFCAAWSDVAAGVTDVDVLLGCSPAPSAGPDAVRWVLELASEAPGEISLGLNCCEGPVGLRPVLEELCEQRGAAWVMPSAGLPSVDARGVPSWPLAEPATWAEQVLELVDELPVLAVGGCCGTTPGSIEQLLVLA